MKIVYSKQTAGQVIVLDEQGRAQFGKENYILTEFRRLERTHNKKTLLTCQVCVFSSKPEIVKDVDRYNASLHRFEKTFELKDDFQGINNERGVNENLDALAREMVSLHLVNLSPGLKMVDFEIEVQEVV